MDKIIEIGVGVSPSIKITLESLGKKKRIFLNTNGGMGGGSLILVADILESNDNFMSIVLTERNRTMNVYHRWITYVEDVELYQQVNFHRNDNYSTSPIVKYFITKGGAKLIQSKEHEFNVKKNQYFCLLEEIEYNHC